MAFSIFADPCPAADEEGVRLRCQQEEDAVWSVALADRASSC